MNTLSVGPVVPLAVGVLTSALPVIQPPAGSTAPNPKTAASASALSPQGLAQSLFQRTLQAATTYPVAEPASGSSDLLQEAATSLLAALSAPQATADTTPVPTATTNPLAVQTSDTSSAAAPSAPPAAIQDTQTAQDALASSSPDFAAQTALRFGAGVAAQAAVAAPVLNPGSGLVRDATSVLRLENVQPRGGGPGSGAFTNPQGSTQRFLKTYEAASVNPSPQGSGTVDLLA